MKTNQTKIKSFLLTVMFVALLAGRSFAQGGGTNTTYAYETFITFLIRLIEFDVWDRMDGYKPPRSFRHSRAGSTSITMALRMEVLSQQHFVPGSADPALPAVQQNPNWNINPVSKQIRFLAAVATPATVAVCDSGSSRFQVRKH
jgi:hypothetical protein